MSAARKRAAAKADLTVVTRADCIVRAANGYQRPDGGVVFSGVLFIHDVPAANFHNDGNGGCNAWTIRAPQLFEQFKALAVSLHPAVRFEQEDLLVGALWDEAFMRRTV